MTQTLETLAALLQGRGPTNIGTAEKQQEEAGPGLAAIAQALGFGPADARAAQQRIAARSLAALWGGRAPSGDEPPPEAVLRAAAAMPQRSGGAPPAGLHSAAAALLPAMRQFPLARCSLSQRGWEAYWLLEPQVGSGERPAASLSGIWRVHAAHSKSATLLIRGLTTSPPPQWPQALWQTLAEVLEAAASGPGDGEAGAAQRVLLALPTRPHWAALAPALSAHPALHLAARQALHAWLGASGSPAAWALLVALVDAARAAHGGALQRGALPPALRALYPPPAQRLALFLHSATPEPEGLPLLAALLCPDEPAQQPGGAQPVGPEAGCWEEQAWRAFLDRPAWLRCALSQLPLGAGGPGEGGGSVLPPGSAVLAAAAGVAAWALLPHAATLRQAVAEALGGELDDCDPAALRPWLATLRRWQALWADAL